MEKNAEMGVKAHLLIDSQKSCQPSPYVTPLDRFPSCPLFLSHKHTHTEIYSKMLPDPEVPRIETAFSCCGV